MQLTSAAKGSSAPTLVYVCSARNLLFFFQPSQRSMNSHHRNLLLLTFDPETGGPQNVREILLCDNPANPETCFYLLRAVSCRKYEGSGRFCGALPGCEYFNPFCQNSWFETIVWSFRFTLGPNPQWTRACKFAGTCNSFDVAWIQCEHSHSHQQVPFACICVYTSSVNRPLFESCSLKAAARLFLTKLLE